MAGSTDISRNTFEALALPHLGSVRGLALKLTRNPADADDLLQEALLRAFRGFHLFADGTNFGGWLNRIVTNTFINQYRRRVRERNLLEHPERMAEGVFTPVAMVATDAVLPQSWRLSGPVVAALEALPAEFATVVLMADLHEMSYREIADTLDVPVGTVMSRLFRGRRLLQTRLASVAQEYGIGRTARTEGNAQPVALAAYRARHAAPVHNAAAAAAS